MTDEENEVNVHVLLKLVEQTPILWDKSCEDRTTSKSVAWQEICTVLNPGYEHFSQDEKNHYEIRISKRWKGLRDRYVKSLKKKGTSKYHDQFKFYDKNFKSINTLNTSEEKTDIQDSEQSDDSSLRKRSSNGHNDSSTSKRKCSTTPKKIIKNIIKEELDNNNKGKNTSKPKKNKKMSFGIEEAALTPSLATSRSTGQTPSEIETANPSPATSETFANRSESHEIPVTPPISSLANIKTSNTNTEKTDIQDSEQSDYSFPKCETRRKKSSNGHNDSSTSKRKRSTTPKKTIKNIINELIENKNKGKNSSRPKKNRKISFDIEEAALTSSLATSRSTGQTTSVIETANPSPATSETFATRSESVEIPVTPPTPSLANTRNIFVSKCENPVSPSIQSVATPDVTYSPMPVNNRHLAFMTALLPSLDSLTEDETLHFQCGVIEMLRKLKKCRQIPEK